jgi:hypothetical protein
VGEKYLTTGGGFQVAIREEDTSLLELIRYIHLSLLRANKVLNLESLGVYLWSGHAVLLENAKLPGQTITAGCSIFDIKDYNKIAKRHNASPGKKWIGFGPTILLG